MARLPVDWRVDPLIGVAPSVQTHGRIIASPRQT
jgi:hypothetical protein